MTETVDAPPLMGPPTALVPNPDPATRTVEQLQREIGATRQIVEANGRATREVLETRLAGMDKAIELLQRTTDKLPEQIRNEVKQLEFLHGERFNSINSQINTHLLGIDKQFAERDKRTEQLSLADKTAIAAALQAQKEAAGAQNDSNSTANIKMEANFAKLIEQTQTLLQEVRRNTDDKINDVKSRLDKGEGHTNATDPLIASAIAQLTGEVKSLKSIDDRGSGHSAGSGQMIGYLVGVGGFVIACLSIFVAMSHNITGGPNPDAAALSAINGRLEALTQRLNLLPPSH